MNSQQAPPPEQPLSRLSRRQQTIISQLQISGDALLGVTKGLTEADATARPSGLTPITWQLGHAVYYEAELVSEVNNSPLEIPADYRRLFSEGTRGDGELPPLEEVQAAAVQTHGYILQLAEGDLDRPVDGGDMYSNVAEALVFYHFHRGYHLAKIMTLRALLGKHADGAGPSS